jgi:hypothetical protein
MKSIVYLVIFYILLFYNQSCINNSASEKKELKTEYVTKYTYTYTLKNYVTKEFDLYEPKNNLFLLLDSIIASANSCPQFKNTQIIYSIVVDSILASKIKITINAYDYRPNDLLLYNADALFFYKGYQFMYFGKLLDVYFINTNTTIKRNCIKPVKTNPNHEIIFAESMLPKSYWCYTYENNKLINIEFIKCNNDFWYKQD